MDPEPAPALARVKRAPNHVERNAALFMTFVCVVAITCVYYATGGDFANLVRVPPRAVEPRRPQSTPQESMQRVIGALLAHKPRDAAANYTCGDVAAHGPVLFICAQSTCSSMELDGTHYWVAITSKDTLFDEVYLYTWYCTVSLGWLDEGFRASVRAWSAEREYAVHTWVAYGDQSYVAITASVGKEPWSNPDCWVNVETPVSEYLPLARGERKPAPGPNEDDAYFDRIVAKLQHRDTSWRPVVTYKLGDVVAHESARYICIVPESVALEFNYNDWAFAEGFSQEQLNKLAERLRVHYEPKPLDDGFDLKNPWRDYVTALRMPLKPPKLHPDDIKFDVDYVEAMGDQFVA